MTEQRNDAVRLKPCPFCGSGEHLSFSWPGSMLNDMPDRPCRVICSHIDHDAVVGPTAYGKYEAIAAWNERPRPPASSPLEGEVREARAIVSQIAFSDFPGKTYNDRVDNARKVLAALSTEAGSWEVPYASDDWKLKGYPSAAAEIEDMANVGRDFMGCVAEVVKSNGPFKGWHPADCPTELVSDMANMIDELSAAIAEAGKPAPAEPVAVWQADIATILSHHHLGGPWRQYRQEPPFAAVCGCGETFYAKSEGDARTAWIAHVSDYLYAAPVEPAPSDEHVRHLAAMIEEYDMMDPPDSCTGHNYEDMARDMLRRLFAHLAEPAQPEGPPMPAPSEERLRDVISEAILQLEYLDEKYPTGTTPATITRLRAALSGSAVEDKGGENG